MTQYTHMEPVVGNSVSYSDSWADNENPSGTGIQNQIPWKGDGCSQNLIYDFADWGYIGHYIAWNCQAWQGARGGRCVATDGADFYLQ